MTSDTAIQSPEDRYKARIEQLGADPRRQRVFDAFSATGLPHRRVEGWRWSDLRSALKSVDNPSTGNAPKDDLALVDGTVFRFSDNGFKPPSKRPAGIQWFEDSSTMPLGAAEDLPMGALAAALSNAPPTLVVEITGDQPQPIRFVFEGQFERFARVSVIVREAAKACILESHLSSGEFSNTMLEYIVEDDAILQRVVFQASAPLAVQVVTSRINLLARSRLQQVAVVQGAKLLRCETHVVHDREGSDAIMDGAYVLANGRHADLTSHVRHAAEACLTRQTVKGAVNAGGKAAFQGKFLVKRGAQHTDASMSHNALLLQDGAEVNAKPELEIYADDVQCAHGNTCGALDDDALFYMRQRGIPEAEARAMLTESFIAEGLANAPSEDLIDILKQATRRWLREGA